ncbi:MAG: hypothetical protein RBT74_17405 [Tenuifilaceae bacterium]|jgi:hypothetical protein|nr:hypothetical protein [Tenuifilaceae bacterium]MDX9848759.1 hypothetical protein [Tenuifilaceae bacterium]
MKIDPTVLKYCCTIHSVKCQLNGKTITISGTQLSMGKPEHLKPNQGREALEVSMTKPLEAVIPKRKIEAVLASYRKVMKVKADYRGLSLSEVKI